VVYLEQKELFTDYLDVFKREVVSQLFSLKIYSKTITLLGGPSTSGKTITCLHFADYCVNNNKSVCYFDTDNHPVVNRPDPNLLADFSKKNKDKYKKYFKYSTSFSEDIALKTMDDYKPSLLIIDSIYTPFYNKIQSNPRGRARAIRKFLMNLREKIQKYNSAVIITSQVTKELSKDEGMIYTILGGEGLKHSSDCKWMIEFTSDKGKGDSSNSKNMGKRVMVIDKQQEVTLTIEYGGKINKLK